MEIFKIYLAGCIATLLLDGVYGIYTFLTTTFTGSRIFAKNLVKILPQDGIKNLKKFSWGCLLSFVLLSWVGFVIVTISIVHTLISQLLSLLRSWINPMPETARVFEYRLKSHKEMIPEAVWANIKSMRVIETGDYPTATKTLSDLEETAAGLSDFNILLAASLLNDYGVLNFTNPSIADLKKEKDTLGLYSPLSHEVVS